MDELRFIKDPLNGQKPKEKSVKYTKQWHYSQNTVFYFPLSQSLGYVRRCLLPGCQGPRIAAESWRVGLLSDQLTVSLRRTRGLSKKAEKEQVDCGLTMTWGQLYSQWAPFGEGSWRRRNTLVGAPGPTDWLSLETSEPYRRTKYRPQWGVSTRAHPPTTGPLVNVTWLKVCQNQSTMLC